MRYINLLCVACKEDANGRLPDTAQIAFMIRLTEEETVQTLDVRLKLGCLKLAQSLTGCTIGTTGKVISLLPQSSNSAYRDRGNALRNGHGNALRNDEVTNNVTSRGRESREESDEKKEEKPPRPPRGEIVFVLPDCIPKPDWEAYIDMRRGTARS